MPLTTLFLDAGGVLVFPNWRRVAETLARHGVETDAARLMTAEPEAKFAIDEGIRTADSTDAQRAWAYMELVLEHAGITLSERTAAALAELRAYHAEHNLWEHVPDDVLPALDDLASLVPRLVVVSNANGILASLFARLGLTRYFHTVCDSCVEGVEKPDPRFFRIALDRCGGEPASTIHVGDLYHVDVVGARNAGLGAILIDPHDLYKPYDVERVRSLGELAARVRTLAAR